MVNVSKDFKKHLEDIDHTWVPVVPRSDGSIRKYREGEDDLSQIIGFLKIIDGKIGVAMDDAKPGELVKIKPFAFYTAGSMYDYTGELMYEVDEDDSYPRV